LVSSDSIWCARAIAIEQGIITKQEALEEYVCLEGKDLLKYVGGLKVTYDEFGDITKEEVVKKIAFKTVCSKLRVLARCTPEVKYLLTTGLKEDSMITVTGKCFDEVETMVKADVGVCLGGRVDNDNIKDVSDIVLIDDSLKYIVQSLKWGRALYANVRKYL